MQLHLLAFLDAILEKHVRLLPDKSSGKSVASYIYYVKLRYRGLVRICCQSPGSSRASAGSFIATFSSGYRLRQERRPHARTHARTHASHRAGAGVSTSLSVLGAHGRPAKRGWGNSQVHLKGLLARGTTEATIQDNWPVHCIALCGHMLVNGSARACAETTEELKSPESSNRQS